VLASSSEQTTRAISLNPREMTTMEPGQVLTRAVVERDLIGARDAAAVIDAPPG
jgi:hypothetical protein